ncbi:hypothetical protein BJ878DRAFT_496749, partial [Calycina marina]
MVLLLLSNAVYNAFRSSHCHLMVVILPVTTQLDGARGIINTLHNIKDFLVILKSTTKSLEGHHHTLNRVIPSMDFILSQYEKAKITYANYDDDD